PGRKLFVNGDAGGTGAWNNDSHSSYKENFKDILVLGKISELNIKEWQYRSSHLSDNEARHISPFSEDFYAKFGLGQSDYTIQSLDVAGVALKGVQELDQKLNPLRYGIDIATNFSTSTPFIKINENGNIIIGNASSSPLLPDGEFKVEIVDLTEINATSTQTALIVNQGGDGDVADFQANGISIVNIESSGQVKIVGSMLVDGRIMLCTGGNCSNVLDSAVDETQADLGVEGKVVAGSFEGYCDENYIWVPGSAKYGTLPGFCVMNDLMKTSDQTWTNVSQGEAQIACQSLGVDYHLLNENEWMTIAENILKVTDNDIDATTTGMQLATSTSATSTIYKLTNNNIINNLTGAIAEWTNRNVTPAGLPTTPTQDAWFEYNEVVDYKGLNIAPDYYLTDANNYIGKIFIGSQPGLKGIVRGTGGIYGLDLSHVPDEKSASIGFRCAK
ncbi:tail fiber domain-containing protein, partial [Patescibacteria group bacterium]|nr:tail fiber domain-containing protein [Patescibacteria group bacterium]MBU1870868.1 tail fiber domain-containing protein [Patescibacteria group bacterium]